MRPQQSINTPLFLSSLVVSVLLGGCASGADPWKGWNQGAQSFNDGLDKGIIKPVAQGYQYVTPDVIDKGVSNFFSNINDIGVTVNDLLQFKILQSGMDASRLLVNTTVGIAGVMDVAQMIDLPKHHEDFGQTLGVWGVPTGPYLVLPIFGSSSPRDTVGLIGDALLNPLTYVSFIGGTAAGAATAGSKVVDVADTRADVMATEKIVDEASSEKNRYDFIKNAYQQRREYLVKDGNVPEDDSFDIDAELTDAELTDDADGASKTSSTTTTDTVNIQPIKPMTPLATGTVISEPAPRHVLELSSPEQ
ncbi:MAG: VacJ family lipoprotein [Methylovulum sp.]|nr:VacJ family lipoprotein [Methylovulum sp.]